MTSTLEYGTEYASRIIMGFTAVSRMEVRRQRVIGREWWEQRESEMFPGSEQDGQDSVQTRDRAHTPFVFI